MIYLLIIAALVGGIAFGLSILAPGALSSEGNQMSFVYYFAWLMLVGSAIFATFRQRWGEAIKYGIAWTLILLVLVAGYSLRGDIERAAYGVVAALLPGLAVEVAPGTVELRIAEDGHFYARAEIDGSTIRLMVDTGASMIALSHEDAVRIGIDPERLDFTLRVSTANGTALAAPIVIDQMVVGPIVLREVRGAVSQPGRLEGSLLGMSFLGRLDSYRFEGDRLVLRY